MARISRALIADSNLASLNDMGAQFRIAGCLSLIETSVSRIKERARAERPDVVVLGVGFSETELIRAADELKSDPVTRRMPLVLAGPAVQHMAIHRDLIACLDGMLTLPILAEELVAKLGTSLRLKIMRNELLRRHVTYGRYGIDGFIGLETTKGERTRVLFVRPSTGPQADQAARLMRLIPGCDPADLVEPMDAIGVLLDSRYDAAVILGNGSLEDPGFELCADVRRHSSLFHLPIVYLEPREHSAARAQSFIRGASEVLTPPFESEALLRSLSLVGRQANLRSRLHAAYRKGAHPETNDPGTGLFTTEFLHKHLDLLIEDAFRWDLSLSVVTCVVPQFAAIRHDHGRDAAASLQRAVGGLILRLVRGEDLCARLGDHAFCIVTPESSLEGTAPIMNRLRGVIDHTEFGVPDINSPFLIHAEVGSAEFKPGDTVESLLGRAQDAALRVAA